MKAQKQIAIAGLFGLTALSLTVLSGCGDSAKKAAPPATPVTVMDVQNSNVMDYSDFVATLIARQSVTLQSQVAGQIRAIYAKPGDTVRKGAPLLLIDPDKQRASVNSSAAAALAQRSSIKQAQDNLHTLTEQRRALVSAVSVNTESFKRYSLLVSQQSASQQDLEKYQDALNQAKANLDANASQIQAQKSAVVTSQSQYQQAQAATQQEAVQLQYFKTTAPFAGVIGDIPVKTGDYVQAQAPLLSVTNNRPLEVNISVPSERLRQIKIGLPVQILDEDSKIIGIAHIFFISPAVDPLAQTILIKAILPNADGMLKAAQVVNARIVWKVVPGLAIPTQSVIHLGGRDFVYTVLQGPQPESADDKKEKDAKDTAPPIAADQWVAYQRSVVVDHVDGLNYVLKSGLKPGERLVTSGVQKLKDGTPVAIGKQPVDNGSLAPAGK